MNQYKERKISGVHGVEVPLTADEEREVTQIIPGVQARGLERPGGRREIFIPIECG